jgi:hypothetical protein
VPALATARQAIDQEGTMMKSYPSSTRVAFVVHLDGPKSAAADVARIQHVVHLFRGHHIPATWAIANCDSLQLMQHKGLLEPGDELALALPQTNSLSSNAFRESLRNKLTEIRACSRTTIHLAAGEPTIMRIHAATFAEQGIRGIVAESKVRQGELSYTPLPCGLWQLNQALTIPQKSWLSWLFSGSAIQSFNKLLAKRSTVLIAVDASRIAHASARSLQSLEKLLRHVSHIASHDELAITTAGEIIAELAASRVARPQHSILRAA